MDYPGIDGFLGTRAGLMLDVVVVAMAAVLPAMGASIWIVRAKRNYRLHKWLQIALTTALLLTVTAFEVDIRLHGWEERAKESPYFATLVRPALWVHLFFAVSTLVIWVAVVVQAVRKFPADPVPGPHSAFHRPAGWIAAGGMTMTAVTGWIFYYLAFVPGP
jgi:hypothetical protein